MSVAELMSSVSPPSDPIENIVPPNWSDILQLLHAQFPSDVIDASRLYGSGRFLARDFLQMRFVNPFSNLYLEWVTTQLDLLRQGKTFLGEDAVPYLIHPEMPGLFPWGHDDNGGVLYWLTEGRPDDWPIIVRTPDGDFFQRFDMTMTTFLAKIFRRELNCALWPASESSSDVVFERSKELLWIILE